MVGLGGHVDVIIVTMTITVTKLYHPFGAAPLLGLQTVNVNDTLIRLGYINFMVP